MKVYLDALSRKPTVSVGTIAYIISNMQIISQAYPNCEFVMLSVNPEVDNLYISRTPYKVNLLKRSRTEIGTFFQIRKILKEVDVVVSSWGDAYISSPPYLLFPKTLFLKKRNVPLILFPSSIGPFKGGIKDFIAYLGLKKFDVITIRDIISFKYLTKFSLNNMKLIHDTAFVLKPESDTLVDNILNDLGLRKNKFIGLNISILLYYLYKKAKKNYLESMAEFIKLLREEFKIPVLLIPHQVFPETYSYSQEEYKSQGGDDRYAIKLVLNELEEKEEIYHLSNYYTPSELKGIIGRSEIFIGGRMHSIIGSVSLCVPSLILEYSHKALGMMKMLEMEEFVWTISSDEKLLRSKVVKLWNEKEEIRQRLNEKMPSIISDIYNLTDEIKRLYSNNIGNKKIF